MSEIVVPRGFAAAPPATKSSYQVSGKFTWNFKLTETFEVDTTADIGVNYDANRAAGQNSAARRSAPSPST